MGRTVCQTVWLFHVSNSSGLLGMLPLRQGTAGLFQFHVQNYVELERKIKWTEKNIT